MTTPKPFWIFLCLFSLLSGCHYEELFLPSVQDIRSSLRLENVDGFELQASVTEGSKEFIIIRRGFLVTEEAFVEDTDPPVGKYPSTDRWVLADENFRAHADTLEIGYRPYAVKAFIDIRLEGTTDSLRLFSQETGYGQTGELNLISTAVVFDFRLNLTLSVAGLRAGDFISEVGHCWMVSGEEPLQEIPEAQLKIENTPLVFHLPAGAYTPDSTLVQQIVTPGRGQFIYLRPYGIRRTDTLYGEVKQFFLGDYWEELGPWEVSPGELTLAASFSLDGYGYVVTGRIYEDNVLKELTRACWKYLPEANGGAGAWEPCPEFPGGTRQDAMSFVIGDTAYVGGGRQGQAFFNDFYAFTPETGWWEVDGLPKALTQGSGFSKGGMGYLVNGYRRENSNTVYFRRAYRFNPNGAPLGEWEEIPGFTPTEMLNSVAFCTTEGCFVGTGGYTEGFLDKVYKFNDSESAFSLLPSTPLPGAARRAAFSFVIENRAYVGGGASYWDNPEATGAFSDVWKFNPENREWTEVASLENTNRYGAATFKFKDISKAFIYGGVEAHPYQKAKNTMLVYTPNRN